ncbi:MAG TPA: hypothetical protein VI893_01650, partial [Thermoplasmata archaeon]|nr:hypothetical protein [Thermoplasmata archaeon]
ARLVDSRGVPVVSAEVSTDRAGALVGSAVTGADGKVDLRLPTGDSRVLARWYGIQVHESTQTVTKDEARDLAASVFYLMVKPRDSRGAAVGGAPVDVWVGSALVSSSISDAAGDAEVRAPATSVVLKVHWRGVEVASESRSVTKDEAIVIAAKVYYLTVKVTDREGKPVGDTEVSVRTSLLLESNFTAGDGATVFRLPNQTYEVTVRYRTAYYLTPVDVSASKPGLLLAGDTEISVVLSDYPPSVFATGAFAIGALFALLAILALVLVYLIVKKRRAGREPATADLTDDIEDREPSMKDDAPSVPAPPEDEDGAVEHSEETPAEAAKAPKEHPGKRAMPPPFAALPPSEIEQGEGQPSDEGWPMVERKPSRLDKEEDLLQPPSDAAEEKQARALAEGILDEGPVPPEEAPEGASAGPSETRAATLPAAPIATLTMGEAKAEGKCALCNGKIKPGSLEAVCECAAEYHVACGKRAKKCGSCGKEFKTG